MPANNAFLYEIFSSFQGEGLYTGLRQIFVRFAGCNLACDYCDTTQNPQMPQHFKYEALPGTKKYDLIPNPINAAKLVDIICALNKPEGANHSISLTGGEPLLQVEFLKLLLPELKAKANLPIYLETNGVLPDYLAEIIDTVDIIAMDFKLPSAYGGSAYWKEHKKMLETAYLKSVFVKIVFTKETNIKEIEEAAAIIAEVDDKIPLILQPVSPHGKITHRPSVEQIFAFHNLASKKLKNVRVVPQTHKILGLL